MKKNFSIASAGFVLFLFAFLLQGCIKDRITRTYTVLTPIYKTKAEVQANIKSNTSQTIEEPGKIFIYGNYIFLNEKDKGVHIIDNANPSNPVVKAFIDIPGNLDIAVKGNILYADMYSDLVTIDISDPLHVKLLKTLPAIFPERSYVNGFFADNNRVIVGWERKTTTEEIKPSRDYILFSGSPTLNSASFYSASASTGMGGSMARFSIVNDYLYTVDRHTLKSISIAEANNPKLINTTSAGWDIETMYPLKNKLFLGSMGGMFIFDISNPAAPVKESDFVHARACDPVVADGSYAYVTLRAGTNCGPTKNELQIIDIRDLKAPVLYSSYSMTNPHGLSKDGNTLLICDGTDGLKLYDASDNSNLQLKKQITGIDTYDVIAWNKNALVVTKDGLYQYDYSDLNNVQLRSKLTVSK